MTNQELYTHYYKRLRLLRSIMNALPNNYHNPRWNKFKELFNHYNKLMNEIDMSQGRSTKGGGNYKSEFHEALLKLAGSREVGNYKSKLK